MAATHSATLPVGAPVTSPTVIAMAKTRSPASTTSMKNPAPGRLRLVSIMPASSPDTCCRHLTEPLFAPSLPDNAANAAYGDIVGDDDGLRLTAETREGKGGAGELAPLTRVQRWERRAEIPLLALALAFLVAYAWPIVDRDLDPDLRNLLTVVSWAVWVAFLLDFAARLALAGQRFDYARRHWYDVALIVLPMLRPLRLLRLLAFARMLNRSAVGSRLAGRVLIYVSGVALTAVGLGALAVLDAEQDAPDANILTLEDALWWATTTVTTVGYGDRFPVTTTGRLVAVALMLSGIAFVGAVTAGIAAWLVDSVQRGRQDERR